MRKAKYKDEQGKNWRTDFIVSFFTAFVIPHVIAVDSNLTASKTLGHKLKEQLRL